MEIVEDKDEGGFTVSYPDLLGAITCGETIERAVENALNAKRVWIETAFEGGVEIHEPDDLEGYSGQFKLRMFSSLHRLLAEHSKREGRINIVYIFFQETVQFIQNENSIRYMDSFVGFSNMF